jgi:hypothetical protein
MTQPPNDSQKLTALERQMVDGLHRFVTAFSEESVRVITPEQEYELVTDQLSVYPVFSAAHQSIIRRRFDHDPQWDGLVLCVFHDNRSEVPVDSLLLTIDRITWWNQATKCRMEVLYHEILDAVPMAETVVRGIRLAVRGTGTREKVDHQIILFLHDALLEALCQFLRAAGQWSLPFFVDLNNAPEAELAQYNWLSPERRSKLVAERTARRGFSSLKEVADVLALHPQELAWWEQKGKVILTPYRPPRAPGRRLDY